MVGPVERSGVHLGIRCVVAIGTKALLVHLEHVILCTTVLDESFQLWATHRPHCHGHMASMVNLPTMS